MRSLNEYKILTARGLHWHVSSVANLLARAQKLEATRQLAFIGGKIAAR